jgi:hypothetical protein
VVGEVVLRNLTALILIHLVFAGLLSSCGEGTPGCKEGECVPHGTCEDSGMNPRCICDSGFREQLVDSALACVEADRVGEACETLRSCEYGASCYTNTEAGQAHYCTKDCLVHSDCPIDEFGEQMCCINPSSSAGLLCIINSTGQPCE